MTDLMFAEFAKYPLPCSAGCVGCHPDGDATPLDVRQARKVFTYSGEPVTEIRVVRRRAAQYVLHDHGGYRRSQGGGDGMIVTDGGRFGGMACIC